MDKRQKVMPVKLARSRFSRRGQQAWVGVGEVFGEGKASMLRLGGRTKRRARKVGRRVERLDTRVLNAMHEFNPQNKHGRKKEKLRTRSEKNKATS